MSGTTRVLVPVYRGVDEVRRCLESVLEHRSATPFELVVIDDASPEPEVVEYLRGLAPADRGSHDIKLAVTHNSENLGFVATVNRGLEGATGHVVILNADTVVTEGWLDRLLQAADEPDVATVTPLTNFGSICTLPDAVRRHFALDGDEPMIEECGRFVAGNGLGLRPEVITGVGFCMVMTRDAIDACGIFDVRTFGRGYGEEVDFCLRATRMGFRHLVEDQTFVYHRGAVSFGADRAEGLERGSMLIRDRYPWFRPTLRREMDDAPLAVSFAALELALTERDERRIHVLHLLHSAPDALGGTEKHLAALMSALRDEVDFSVMYPVRSGFVLRTIWSTAEGESEEGEYLLPSAARRVTRVADENVEAALRTARDLFHFDAVHIQNLIGFSMAPLRALADFAGPVICSVRDPFLACPNHALMYRDQAFCGIPEDLSYCSTCLPETRREDLTYLDDFRSTVTSHLDNVDHWVFASQSAADLLARVYDIDDQRRSVIPHGSILPIALRRTTVDHALVHDEPLRIAFVGLGRAKKGLEAVNWLADRTADTDIELHHFGRLQEMVSEEVHLHGAYDNELLPDLLEAAGVHAVLLPGVVSETFGHVLTEAWIAGRPAIASFYGALGERIRASGAGWTVDPTDFDGMLDLLQHIDQCRDELERVTRAAMATPLFEVAHHAVEYASLYRGGMRP